MSRANYDLRSKRGAKYLDGSTPGWAARVTTTSLDMANGKYCVMSQVDGDVFYRAKAARGMSSRDTYYLGFVGEITDRDCYERLRSAWLARIVERTPA